MQRRVVAAGPNCLLVLGLQVVDALDLAVEAPVARKDSRPGISIAERLLGAVDVADREQREAGAGCSVSYSASAAAIFIGCCFGHDLALHVAGDRDAERRRRAAPRPSAEPHGRRCTTLSSSAWCARPRSHSAMPATNVAAGHEAPPAIVCGKVDERDLLVSTRPEVVELGPPGARR